MAYSGYLVKIGNYTLPNSVIKADTFKSVKAITDLNPYRNANGELIRNALPHIPYKLEMNLIPMRDDQMKVILHNIQSNYTIALERKALVTFYDSESDSYISQYMYMPDIDFQIYGIFDNSILYRETTIKFIGY